VSNGPTLARGNPRRLVPGEPLPLGCIRLSPLVRGPDVPGVPRLHSSSRGGTAPRARFRVLSLYPPTSCPAREWGISNFLGAPSPGL